MSWPVLGACMSFDEIALNMNKKAAILLIYDGEEEFKNVDPTKEWPLLETDTQGETLTEDERRNRKTRHLACILLQLESDILKVGTMTREENEGRQQFLSPKFTTRFPGVVVPKLGYPPHDLGEGEKAPELHLPTMSFEKEHRMESINRCWNLLKYFRYARQSGSAESKFS
jgi:hypothetical protein